MPKSEKIKLQRIIMKERALALRVDSEFHTPLKGARDH